VTAKRLLITAVVVEVVVVPTFSMVATGRSPTMMCLVVVAVVVPKTTLYNWFGKIVFVFPSLSRTRAS